MIREGESGYDADTQAREQESACADILSDAVRSVSIQERGLPDACRIAFDLDL
jgi:hypothetical protein